MFDPAAAKKRCNAATPEPWAVTDRNEAGDRYVGPVDEYVAIVVRSAVNDLPTEANAEFVAYARSDLPAALEALEEAQGKLAWLQGKMRTLGFHAPDDCPAKRDGGYPGCNACAWPLTLSKGGNGE